MFRIINNRPVYAYSIMLVIIAGILGFILLSWGIPVYEIDPKMEVKLPPPTLEELSDYLRKGQYRGVIERGGQLLAKDPKVPVYGLLGVAYAGLNQFDKASEAMKKAKAAGEPNYQLLAHISQGMIHHIRKEYDAAITECREAIKLDPKHPLPYAILGLAYFGKGNYDQAAEHFKKAIAVEPEYAHGHTALGANYLVQKKVREAFMEYRKATEIDPKDPRPHMGLAMIYIGMGMYYHAINEYETVLRLNPSYLQARTQLSALYFRVGKYDDAITEAKAILQTDVQSAQAHLLLGRAYAFKNQFDKAIEHLNQLVGLQPNSLEGHYFLGLTLMAKDDFKSARQHLQQVEQINSKQANTTVVQADTIVVMGIINHVEKNFQQAITEFERALIIGSDRTDTFVHFLIANVYLSQKELAKAKTHLKGANGFILRFQADNLNLERYFDKADPQSSIHTNLAALYLSKGWLDKAIESCDVALKHHKSNPIAMYLKGQAFKQKREFDQAIAQFQSLNKLVPQFISAHYELAELYIARKLLKQAIEEYRKILELNPKEPSAHLKLGAVYEKEGKDKKALNEYQQVMALAPNSAVGYNQLAYYYAQRERNLDEALILARKAVELAPKSGAILDTLGWVHFKRGNYSKALEKLKLAAQWKSNSQSIRYHLGMVYFKSGDSQNALNEFKNALRISPQFPEVDDTKAMIKTIEEK